MGRSVSNPHDAVAVCFGQIESGMQCHECGDTWGALEYRDDDVCPSCGAESPSLIDEAWEFECLVDNLRYDFEQAFKTMSNADRWIDREDRVILANRYAEIGISEYCGTVAVWLRPAPRVDNESFRDRWIDSVIPRFKRLCEQLLPRPMRRMGVMSNGCAVYKRVA